MAIDRLDFDRLSEADLGELLEAQVPEGLRIDYKRDLYGPSDADRREVMKDVSAFANAFGGHLIIGVEEQNGIPVAIPGIANINPDHITERLGQIIRDGIEPRIQHLRIRAVRLSSGTHCIVLRVPRSWYPPHRVSAQRVNKFWIRNSSGAHEASVDELRSLFNLGADAMVRVRQFRDERLGEILSTRGVRPLQGNGRLIIHIVPLASVTSSIQIDMAKAHELQRCFRPIGSNGFSPRINFEGFVNERGGERNFGYTQIFRNGAVEGTYSDFIRQRNDLIFIPALRLESALHEILASYINGMRDLALPPPLLILVTLEGVAGSYYGNGNEVFIDQEPTIEKDLIFLPECLIHEYGPDIDYHLAFKPAIDALWNTCGRISAPSYMPDGSWNPNRR